MAGGGASCADATTPTSTFNWKKNKNRKGNIKIKQQKSWESSSTCVLLYKSSTSILAMDN